MYSTALMEFPGIGPKVADCICLLSLDKTEAIPVDTHVWQITKTNYMPNLLNSKSLTDKVYKQIGINNSDIQYLPPLVQYVLYGLCLSFDPNSWYLASVRRILGFAFAVYSLVVRRNTKKSLNFWPLLSDNCSVQFR